MIVSAVLSPNDGFKLGEVMEGRSVGARLCNQVADLVPCTKWTMEDIRCLSLDGDLVKENVQKSMEKIDCKVLYATWIRYASGVLRLTGDCCTSLTRVLTRGRHHCVRRPGRRYAVGQIKLRPVLLSSLPLHHD